MKKRNFSTEFKRESAQLVVDQNYTVASPIRFQGFFRCHAFGTDIYIVDFASRMRPASCFRQHAAFTFGTEQPSVTIKRICLQDTLEGTKVLLQMLTTVVAWRLPAGLWVIPAVMCSLG